MLPNFRRGNLATIQNTLRKHQSRPHPFQIQTSKPYSVKTPKAIIANVLKLRFHQNEGLSANKRYGVPNNFPTCNQTSELKNQDFFIRSYQIRKNNLFLRLGLVIKSNKVR